MSKMKSIIVLFSLSISILNNSDASSLRVIGGTPAEEGSTASHASLRSIRNIHVCGGTVISHNAILTAAHCFQDNVLPEYVIAVLGTIKTSDVGDRYNISKIIMHEKYSNETKENDIAIVFTESRIQFSRRVRPLAIWTRYVAEGVMTFTGFGDISQEGTPATDLMQIQLSVLPWEDCERAYAAVLGRKIFKSQICTYNGFNEGTCKGDSGSPLMVNSALVGIASFGVPCAIGMPDVFTRTSHFIDWIQSKVPTI